MQRARVKGGYLAAILFCGLISAGWSQRPATDPPDNAGASALLQEGRDLEAAGDAVRAAAVYRQVVKQHPFSASAPTAQYRVAELLDTQGNSNRAFEAYQQLVEKYPQSEEFDRAVNAQVAIANTYMDRARYDRAAEMYQSILANAPFAKFAPATQFNLGQVYEKKKEYAKAMEAYQVILDRYGSSDYADDALYQIGYVQLSESLSRTQDISAAVDAKNTFEEFLMEYPNSEKAPQARDNLARMQGRESGDLMSIAQFYDRKNEYRAAVVYYSDLVRRLPDSADAKLAKERIEEIRATVGDDELRAGPERPETGERAALRRRLQNQVETSALSNYAGPPVSAFAPAEELPAPRPRLRTSAGDVQPMAPVNQPPVEPELPIE